MVFRHARTARDLPALLRGELDERASRSVLRHLEGCRRCREEAAALAAYLAAPVPDPGEPFWEGLAAAAAAGARREAMAARRRPSWRPLAWSAGAVAAAVLVVLVLARRSDVPGAVTPAEVAPLFAAGVEADLLAEAGGDPAELEEALEPGAFLEDGDLPGVLPQPTEDPLGGVLGGREELLDLERALDSMDGRGRRG